MRAEQRFEDWAPGEVRTIAHTRAVETLINDGRVSVIAADVPPPDVPPAVPEFDGAELLAEPGALIEEPSEAPAEPASRRRRGDRG